MSTFVDTSALYAYLDADDRSNGPATSWWRDQGSSTSFLTHNYVVVEAIALIQRRLGTDAVRTLRDALLVQIDVHWVDRKLHSDALVATIASGRGPSFVDRTSFAVMRQHSIEDAFAFDDDFKREGFRLVA